MEIRKLLGRTLVEERHAVALDRIDYELVFDLRADDARFSTEIGTPSDQGAVYSFQPNGFLIYGPYIDLDPGKYVVDFAGEAYLARQGKFMIEVTANAGEVYLASKTVKGDDALYDFGAVEFDLKSSASYVEIRIFVENSIYSECRGLKINRVQVESASDSHKVFDNGNTVGILRCAGFGRLAIVFYPMNSYGAANEIEDWRFWSSRGYDLLYFTQRCDNWYQDVASFRGGNLLKSISVYKERLAFGVSMGGYAALYFASRLGVQNVIAFSPQYSVRKSLANFENRWSSLVASAGFSHDWGENTYTGAVHILFDPKNDLDQLHVEKLRLRFGATREIKIPYAGHLAQSAISNGPCVGDVLVALLDNVEPNFREVRLNLRARRTRYMSTLISSSMKRSVARSERLLSSFVKSEKPGVAWAMWATDRLAEKAEMDGDLEVLTRIRNLLRRTILSSGIVYVNKSPAELWVAPDCD
ncbi:hypothetical protein [Burkholderia sp. Ac-20349]|uniref:hypothetical protein n=1 Tax=Burkholderia sp. Ac-20349 TaxID=2703893 RepID=UPI00197BF721|nr:hypothetical protein [Burkholderia sp. Ac-20349]MBN3841818.1 hypothetical protein [Burkholderia sp. Ac-20349]